MLDTIDLEDPIQSKLGLGCNAERFEELSAGVGQTTRSFSAIHAGHRVVTGVHVDHECAAGATEYVCGRFTAAVRAETIGDEIFGDEGPDVRFLVGCLHAIGGFVCKDDVARSHHRQNPSRDDAQARAHSLKQVGHGRARHGYAEAMKLLLEAIQRNTVAAFAHHQVSHEAWSVLGLVEHLVRHRCDDHMLTAGARELLAAKDALAKVTRNVLDDRTGLAITDGQEVFASAFRAAPVALRHGQLESLGLELLGAKLRVGTPRPQCSFGIGLLASTDLAVHRWHLLALLAE